MKIESMTALGLATLFLVGIAVWDRISRNEGGDGKHKDGDRGKGGF